MDAMVVMQVFMRLCDGAERATGTNGLATVADRIRLPSPASWSHPDKRQGTGAAVKMRLRAW
jgi:hypothetical protein